jgi:hypothetical protein
LSGVAFVDDVQTDRLDPLGRVGSCTSPTLAYVGCVDNGYLGSGAGIDENVSRMICNASDGSTWSSAPCTRSGAVFGCEELTPFGTSCATVTTEWWNPPATVSYETSYCPPPGVIVPP